MAEKIVPDTSILIACKISQLLEAGKLQASEFVVPLSVLDELQAQASKGQEVGFIGLSELKKIQELSKDRGIPLRFAGERPSLEDIKLSRSGRIDALIMDVSKNEDGILYTCDYVQALVAEAKAVRVRHITLDTKPTGPSFEEFFQPDTLSVHLKEDVLPMAKRGKPGKVVLEKIREKKCTAEELDGLVKNIFEAVRTRRDGFVEISRAGASVIQLGNYRIAVARPPFSDGVEVTIVRPSVKLGLEDYKLSDKLVARLKERAEGILIAGPPGSGKTTFAASLAEFHMHSGKVVKTLESPRDLQVGPEITQYGPLEGDFEKTADILLLVRPDFTVFDEIRKTRDFQVFADMRLSGVGMIGVVHANDPIGSIQRFLGRVELGMIPHVIDTVVFIRYGTIEKLYELDLVVKVPTGMIEADLARPLVEVKDFETGRLEYEIYTFGEENVIMPVSKKALPTGVRKMAAKYIAEEICRFDPECEVELLNTNRALVKVDSAVIPMLIGKEGVMISKIEEKLGIHITVEPRVATVGKPVKFNIEETGTNLTLCFDRHMIGKTVSVYVEGNFLFSAIVGKKGYIKVAKRSNVGVMLTDALTRNIKIDITA